LIVLFSYRKWIYVGEKSNTQSLIAKGGKEKNSIVGEPLDHSSSSYFKGLGPDSTRTD